ncbi:Phytochelatin-domain-containing protein, partial [Martensiomyces pterosporus]
PSKSFYRRELPRELVSFTSAEGRRLFKESLNEGYAEGYFNLAGNFTVQSEPAYCGPSSLAMVLNALEVDPGRTWKGVWRWYSDELLESCRTETELKASGITFDQFICLASSHAHVVAKRGNEVSREEFLEDIKRVTQRDDMFLVLSFSRKMMGQTGDGHFSPIGAYHPETNQALVLDSARYKYPCWFADVDKIYGSLQPADEETGRPRGYFLVSRKD